MIYSCSRCCFNKLFFNRALLRWSHHHYAKIVLHLGKKSSSKRQFSYPNEYTTHHPGFKLTSSSKQTYHMPSGPIGRGAPWGPSCKPPTRRTSAHTAPWVERVFISLFISFPVGGSSTYVNMLGVGIGDLGIPEGLKGNEIPSYPDGPVVFLNAVL